ncbi:phosphatase 1G [Brachionus plicatilis]|uniref:protein-serine/threonine phosphatase n=1 Tax=Brachionus plicatilis TaxID=10195 RepID=A0A3M7S475_BRAPC|nr:phosphatase 1G [Brachionus plicatilis]
MSSQFFFNLILNFKKPGPKNLAHKRMGAYLSEPNTNKESMDGDNEHMSFGASSMQGWRTNQEDAHNSILDFDDKTSFFAVYDGHGGPEVALYCAKYLPQFLKNLEDYSKGNLEEALKSLFLKFDESLLTPGALQELKELRDLSSRKTSVKDEKEENGAESAKSENDEEPEYENEAAQLYDEATMPLEEVLKRYTKTENKMRRTLKKKGLIRASSSLDEKPATFQEQEERDMDEIKKNSTLDQENCAHDQEFDEASNLGEISDSQKSGLICESNDVSSIASDTTILNGSNGQAGSSNEENKENDCEKSSGNQPEVNGDAKKKDDAEKNGSVEEKKAKSAKKATSTNLIAKLIAGLYVANAGDSRCVVCRDGKAIEMSFDHKPEDEIERQRIEKAGGTVTKDGRVNAGLNLSRAIGDHTYKANKTLSLSEQMITPLPDLKVLDIDPAKDKFMILACDGIWNFMSSQEVCDYVQERLNANYAKLSLICEELFMHCLAPDAEGDGTGCDNMTCILITFNPFRKILLKIGNGDIEKNNLKRTHDQENEKFKVDSNQADTKKLKQESELCWFFEEKLN